VTFSIVARSADGSSWGVAVASKFLAVGAYVPAAQAGTGAIATQSYANLTFREDGLALLRSGSDARQTLDALLAGDELREQRQVGVVDRDGTSATFTGAECNPWAGGLAGNDYAIQGNILAGGEVVAAMERAWLESVDQPDLELRLLAALEAGDSAGGDRRGRQSAALFTVRAGGGYGGGNDVVADLRVDDHPEPVKELRRLAVLRDLYFGTTAEDELLALTGPLLADVARMLADLGYPPGDEDPASVRQALWDWACIENLEERVPDALVIDPAVLGELKKARRD
jgi:uncharacterized Ntn-hydrolase superfamily protein